MNRETQLTAEGFERVQVAEVALPHMIWKLDIEIEIDRDLTLAEETVLRLIDAGVREPAEITRLMGLQAGVIVPTTIVNLLTKGLLGHTDALQLMPLGREAIMRHQTKETRAYTNVEVRYDPYTDAFCWKFDVTEWKKKDDVGGTHVLPTPRELTPLQVDVRHAEIQLLMDRFGLPFDRPDEGKVKKGEKKPARDIVRLTARHAYPAWRPAQLEVWHHPDRQEWRWRLLYEGGELGRISEVLESLDAEGQVIIPLEREVKAPALSAVGEEIQGAVKAVEAQGSVIQTEHHRDALREAIEEAQRELIIISPWLTTAAVDGDLMGWLKRALDRRTELRIIIGYGIEADTGKRDFKVQDQRNALRKLNELGQRHRGRLRTVEIGNTHQKLIICDQRRAIVTSFNWLSFKPTPGRGLRRETGLRVDEVSAVVALRASLADALGLPAKG
jgi:hypothetical protein